VNILPSMELTIDVAYSRLVSLWVSTLGNRSLTYFPNTVQQLFIEVVTVCHYNSSETVCPSFD